MTERGSLETLTHESAGQHVSVIIQTASAGNRARGTSMATMYSATRPLMLLTLKEQPLNRKWHRRLPVCSKIRRTEVLSAGFMAGARPALSSGVFPVHSDFVLFI